MTDSYYKHHVFFCTNQRPSGRACCGNHNAQAMRDYMKSQIKALGLNGKGGIRINSAGCMDRCALGPTMVVYPESTWYSYQTEQDLDEIIKSHLQGGQIVTRLQLEK
jgi:(2Fe-2S) ferredoxin